MWAFSLPMLSLFPLQNKNAHTKNSLTPRWSFRHYVFLRGGVLKLTLLSPPFLSRLNHLLSGKVLLRSLRWVPMLVRLPCSRQCVCARLLLRPLLFSQRWPRPWSVQWQIWMGWNLGQPPPRHFLQAPIRAELVLVVVAEWWLLLWRNML